MTTNLSGSLSEFSLAEVLSLLGMGGRTARMQVSTPDSVGIVHLVDGEVCAATADSARAGLLRAVVAGLPVPADDLARPCMSAEPVRALVDSGVLDAMPSCRWLPSSAPRRSARCSPGPTGSSPSGSEPRTRRTSGCAWASTTWCRRSPEAGPGVERPQGGTARGGLGARPRPRSRPAPGVDVDDWAVLARVDGRRTLAEVLAAMGASPLASGGRLVRLMGRGLVVCQRR